jgi:hypothetical protein
MCFLAPAKILQKIEQALIEWGKVVGCHVVMDVYKNISGAN